MKGSGKTQWKKMVLNTELIIIHTSREKIRQCMLGGESLGEKVGNYPGALNASTHRLLKISVEGLKTNKALLLPSSQMHLPGHTCQFFKSTDHKQATR